MRVRRLAVIVLAFALLGLLVPAAKDAAADVGTNPDLARSADAETLARQLFTDDVEISDVAYVGHDLSVSAFDSHRSGLSRGIQLSTGAVDDSVDHDSSIDPATDPRVASGRMGTAGSAELDALLAEDGYHGSTLDAAVITLTFVPTADQVSFRFVFGSEEFSKSGPAAPDVFGLWINGQNVAQVDGQNVTAPAVRDSDHHRTQDSLNAQLNEAGPTLLAESAVLPHQANTLQIAIADARGPLSDSTVVIEANNLTPRFGETLLVDTFDDLDHWTAVSPGLAVAQTTHGQVVGPTGPEIGVARSMTGSSAWDNFEIATTVFFDDFPERNSWLTLYGRYTDPNNYYLLEFKGHPQSQSLALRKKVDGRVETLQQITDWQPEMGEAVRVVFQLSGGLLRVYIQDALVLEALDPELTRGGAAIATNRASIWLDDFLVRQITNPATGTWDLYGDPVPAGTYYVSPMGSDDNPGTEAKPWRSLFKVVTSVQAGTTVIFEDGTYVETSAAIFHHSGTASAPIVVKARNKHRAKIVFDGLPSNKIRLVGKSHITLDGFEITQTSPGTTTSDILITVREGSDHVTVSNNWVHGAFEDGVKGYLVEDMTVTNNIIEDISHEGVDFVNVSRSTITDNTVRNAGRCGILAKGGSSDIVMSGNTVVNDSVVMVAGAIYLGGATDPVSTKDPSVDGYEAWNIVAYNNIVRSLDVGGVPSIPQGILFVGSKNSAAYNNLISGTKNAFYLADAPGIANGWAWNPQNVNPTIVNNIVVGNEVAAIRQIHPSVNLTHDFNLYHDNGGTVPIENNSVVADPQFVSPTDWHLAATSPAIGAGTELSPFVFTDGTSHSLDMDKDGVPRGTNWSIGPYQA